MRIQNIIVSDKKEDIPRKYLENIFKLMQKSEGEYHPFDPPHLDFFRKNWEIPELSWVKNFRFVGVDENDEVMSYAWLGWNTKFDNLEKSWHYIHLQDNEEKENNRMIMFREIVNSLPEQVEIMFAWHLKETEKEKFYDKFNKEPAYEEILFVANLEEHNLDEVSLEAQKQKTKALEIGYDIIFIEDQNYKEYFEDYNKFVNLIECVWNDMPRENLSEENTTLTVERFDEQCENNRRHYETFLSFVAVEKRTKDPVGITVSIIGDYQPHVAWQWETGVLHEKRGNGLGLALKYQMLERLLKSTKVRNWSTGSASVNVHMHRINELLGYKRWNSEVVYEFTKEELRNFIEEK